MENCKDVHTPADSNSKLVKPMQHEDIGVKYPYRESLGALMYVATFTRPDIAHAVGEVAKFCENYDKSHWIAAKRILKYLKPALCERFTWKTEAADRMWIWIDATFMRPRH